MREESNQSIAARRDRRLPHLERALDGAAMQPRLAGLGSDATPPRITLLKHVAGKRAVLSIQWANGRQVIGKMYRKDRARHHAAVLEQLSAVLAGATRTPRLLACWEDLGLVIQECVPGTPVPDYAHLADHAALVERLGSCLATLHETRVPALAVMDLAAHVRRTCHPGIEFLAADQPALAADIRALERRVLEGARESSQPVTCHGDFGPRQAFIQDDRLWLVDLDGLCRGAAALDVATFRVGLEVHLGEAGRRLGERFLTAYLAARRIDDLPGLGVHEAFCDLRRAMILWRKRPAYWEKDLRRSVERGCIRF